MSKNIGTICDVLKRKTYFDSCRVLNDQKYDTWLKH